MADYQKINFVNEPGKTTPMSAGNLNHMEDGIFNAQAAADHAQADVDNLNNRNLAPVPVSLASEMTEQGVNYLYLGSENGYDYGYLYYINAGGTLTKGSQYQTAQVVTDTTLAVAGAAADSKATGDAVNDLNNALTDTEGIISSTIYGESDAYTYTNFTVSRVSTKTMRTSNMLMFGKTIVATMDTGWKCVFFKVSDNTEIGGWGTKKTVNIANYPAGVYLIIRKSDESAIADEDIATMIAATHITYPTENLSSEVSTNTSNIAKNTKDISALDAIVGKTNNEAEITFDIKRVSSIRIYSKDIAVEGETERITATGGFVFAPVYYDDEEVIVTWTTDYTISYASLNNRGLGLWIKHEDGSSITDSDVENIHSYVKVYMIQEPIFGDTKIAYVATNGNDANVGSYAEPFATVQKAIDRGYHNILVRNGVYEQTVSLSGKNGAFKISPYDKSKKVTFVNPNALKITSATLYSGSVYVADANFAQLSTTPMIFQDGEAETSTLISQAERMPQQRGKTYRVNDTRIYKCTADNLADALTEIEAASGYKYFYDADNHKLYFKSPSTSFATKPIICPDSTTEFFSGLSRTKQLEVSGIDVKYMRFSVANTVNSVITNCMCSGAYANAKGQFLTDDAINAKFVRCEACLSHGASNGDGFNGHSTNSNDADAHEGGTILIDCWAHDNLDDGYSEHYRGESVIIGGLFEYNGKAGVTPSYGTHCVCIGVVARKNMNGFMCLNDSSDNGVGTQMECIDCMAIDNKTLTSAMYSNGFFVWSNDGASNYGTMICKNCYAEGNKYGYRIGWKADAPDNAILINCTALDNTTDAIYCTGSVTVKNGTALQVE